MELFYNPERMSATEIRETFVAHQWLVDEIISILKRQPKGAGVQHAIIVAPRGMGKTTLLLMLRFTVLESELAQSWQPLLFPEESYDIYELADFWIAVLNHISRETEDPALDHEVSNLKLKSRSSHELEEAALARIKDWRTEHKKRLLMLVDSFDIIMEQIGNERDNARLRDELMNDGAMMFVGGATTFFKEARAYEQPLYNLFKVYNLQSLNSDQIHELLRRRAKLDGAEEFEEILRVNATRLRVLEYFTGGNPRLVMMLYRVLTQSQISEVKRGLEKLLDEVTPYYKAKVENLPAQQRKILDHIARISARTREGLTPTEIASSTRLPVNQVSAQLQRLAEAGYVRAANIRARSSYYALSEPLYAIWHQMRFGRDARKRMEWLVTFLKGWYDSKELDSECERLQTIFEEYLTTGRLREARDTLEHRRYLVRAMESSGHQLGSVESIILSYLKLKDVDTLRREVLTDINPALLSHETKLELINAGVISHDQTKTSADGQSRKDTETAEFTESFDLGCLALDNQDLSEALRNFRRATEIDPTSVPAHILLSLTLLSVGKRDEAITTLQEVASHHLNVSAEITSLRAVAAALDNDVEGATKALNDLGEDELSQRTLFTVALIFSEYKHFDTALKILSRVLAIQPDNFGAWYHQAETFVALKRYDKGLDSIELALKIQPASHAAHYTRGVLLMKLGRDQEAVASFDCSIKLSPDGNESWYPRGLSLFSLGQYQEALNSFTKSCLMDPDRYEAFLAKGMMLSGLQRYREAVKSLDQALKIDPNSFDALYLRALSLLPLNRLEEAKGTLKRAFTITTGAHRRLAINIPAITLKLGLSLAEEEFAEAKKDWQRLKEASLLEGGEARWLETASSFVRSWTPFGQWDSIRRLVGRSDPDDPLFPLARALDYLADRDNSLIEKLSPEVRRIVEEIVDTLNKQTPQKSVKKKSRKPQKGSRSKRNVRQRRETSSS